MNPRAAKVITGVSAAAVLAGLVALAAPAVASTTNGLSSWRIFQPAQEPTTEAAAQGEEAEPTPEPTPRDPLQAAAWEIGCDDFAKVGGYVQGGKPSPRPDMGPLPLASGPVTFGADGGVETYTVQPGDAGTSIGERFCVDYVTLFVANGKWGAAGTIQPGDVLLINP